MQPLTRRSAAGQGELRDHAAFPPSCASEVKVEVET